MILACALWVEIPAVLLVVMVGCIQGLDAWRRAHGKPGLMAAKPQEHEPYPYIERIDGAWWYSCTKCYKKFGPFSPIEAAACGEGHTCG